MSFKKLGLAIGLFVGLLSLAGCGMLSDVRSNSYKDYDAVVAAGEIERGWVPDFLPHSATDIHLKYDLDTNAVLLAFRYADDDGQALSQVCTPTDSVTSPALDANWWPNDLQKDGTTLFFQCPGDSFLAIDAGRGYYWSGMNTISVTELYAHPKQYQHLEGQIVTVVGYVDFDNILDKRETYYDRETIGFVRKPGQHADAVFFANFDSSVDPHPLFDRLHQLEPKYYDTGLRLAVTGKLHAFEMPTNFTTDIGYEVVVQSLEDVVILSGDASQ